MFKRAAFIEYAIAAALAVAVAFAAQSARGDDCPPPGLAPAIDVVCHDGDTVKCSIDLGYGITLRDKSIRAFGFDAWEINRNRQTVNVTDAEIERGKAAKAALEALIANGTLYLADSGERDPYGRVSAWLWVQSKDGEWTDVAKYMKQHHHVRTGQ